jgi:hypothetical protein
MTLTNPCGVNEITVETMGFGNGNNGQIRANIRLISSQHEVRVVNN